MTAPGTDGQVLATPPDREAPTDTSRWFIVGLSERGAIGKALGPYRSLNEWIKECGGRQADSPIYDALDLWYHEDGGEVYFSRNAGPGAATATLNIPDAGGAVSLVASASSPGVWGDGVEVAILTSADDAGIPAGQFRVRSTLGTEVEESSNLISQAEAVAWAANTRNLRLAIGVSNNLPNRLANSVLAGGTDDRGNVSDATRQAALDAFTDDLGPGMISVPGHTTDVAHQQVAAHADVSNRVQHGDLIDTPSKATLLASAAAVRNVQGDRFSGLFWPWVQIPALVAGAAPRVAPPSALVSALASRNDGRGLSANQAPAGNWGKAKWAIGLSQDDPSKADRSDLNEGSVNVIRMRYGGVRVYGYRSCADPVGNPNWRQLNWGRYATELIAKGEAILENYVFADVDGQGHLFVHMKTDIVGLLVPDYLDGYLYGATPADAFEVLADPPVNTLAKIAAGEAHAVLRVRMSSAAEHVILDLDKVPTAEAI